MLLLAFRYKSPQDSNGYVTVVNLITKENSKSYAAKSIITHKGNSPPNDLTLARRCFIEVIKSLLRATKNSDDNK